MVKTLINDAVLRCLTTRPEIWWCNHLHMNFNNEPHFISIKCLFWITVVRCFSVFRANWSLCSERQHNNIQYWGISMSFLFFIFLEKWIVVDRQFKFSPPWKFCMPTGRNQEMKFFLQVLIQWYFTLLRWIPLCQRTSMRMRTKGTPPSPWSYISIPPYNKQFSVSRQQTARFRWLLNKPVKYFFWHF